MEKRDIAMAALVLTIVLVILPLIVWNYIRTRDKAEEACVSRGGRFVQTGRGMDEWICVDPKALK
jgi:hypothetical protein